MYATKTAKIKKVILLNCQHIDYVAMCC